MNAASAESLQKVFLNSQAGDGKQGEEKQKGVVGHCFGSEVSVWLAEIITREKKLESSESAELMLQIKGKLGEKEMVRREKRENEERKEGWDA